MEGGGRGGEGRGEKTCSLLFHGSGGEFVCYCKDWYNLVFPHLL